MPLPIIGRRDFLSAVGVTLGGLSLRGYSQNSAAPVYFTHGVASGDPLSDRVILWSRVVPAKGSAPLAGHWQVALDGRFERVVASGAAHTDGSRDYTVKVDATGLVPGQRYFYRFLFDGISSPVGRTRTLPVGSVERFRFGVCSCSNYPQGYFNAYRDMARSDIDVVLHLGDYLYEYGADTYANPVAVNQLGRGVVPSHELLLLEDYRQRYGLYRTDPDLQAAHAAHPWICVWDDHELANDTWRDGAENHNSGEGDFGARIAAARKAYHEWMPIRTAAQTDQGPIYRNFAIGDLADLIMLDTRLQGRDQQLNYGATLGAGMDPEHFRTTLLGEPERTLLGLDQEVWLGNQLAASRDRGAVWQVLGQQVLMGKVTIPSLPADALASAELSDFARRRLETLMKLVPLGLPLNLDAWDGYPAARDRLFRDLLTLASNPVSLAGDTHNGWVFNLRDETEQSVGVEVGCPGISSPGMEAYLPLPAAQLAQALRASSPELIDCDTSRRGWSQLTLTPTQLEHRWRFVSTVLSRDFTVSQGPLHRCTSGDRRWQSIG